MSISTVLNKWLKRLYKLLAISLVLFACFISVLRLFLPYAHYYQENIESYINSTYNINTVIGSLAMDWGESGPTIAIEQLELLSSDGIKITVNNLDVELNFWRSLQTRKPVTENFIISQAVLDVKQASLQKAENAAEKVALQSKNSSLIDSLSSILLEQISRFSIRNSHVLYHTHDDVRAFTINEMFWVNTGDSHRANGSVIFDGLSSNNLKLLVDFKGKKFNSFTGQAYLAAHEIDITPWLDQVLAIDDKDTHSSINFKTWINVKAGKTEQIKLALGNNEISWQHDNNEQTFEVEDGHIQITSLDDFSYNISTSPITIKRNNAEINKVSVSASVNNKGVKGYIDTIELASFNGVFPLLFDNEKIENLLLDLSPTGRIENIHFSGHASAGHASDIAIAANFDNIDSHYSHGIPGIDNVSGELIYQNKKLHILFDANEGALDFDKQFKAPIQYSQLSGEIDAHFLETAWQVSARNIALTSPDITLTGNANVNKAQDKPLTLSLLAKVSDLNAEYAERYYPKSMGENLYNYLDRAIVDGKITQANVLLNGPLQHFPFHNNEGFFVVDAELSDSNFSFDPRWPTIKDFAANLNFTNNSMLITARGGSLSGIDVAGVEATIDDLTNEQILNVTANFSEVQPEWVTELMNTSPMQKSIGSVLEQMVVQGAISGDFSLILPLKKPKAVIAKGYVDFNDNMMLLQAPKMDFSKVNGRLSYYNDMITAPDITVDWRGMPMTLRVLAEKNTEYYGVNIETLGQWQESQWHAQIPDKLAKYAQGQLDWQGKLLLKINKDEFDYDYQINSVLNDITLTMPEPFDKMSKEQVNTNIHAFGDKYSSTINGNIGDGLNFHSELIHQQTHFSLAHLILGKKQHWMPSEGFHITADLEKANYEQWQPFISDILASVKNYNAETSIVETTDGVKKTPPLLSAPNRINALVDNIMAYGQTFHDVNLTAVPEPNWWRLNVNAKEGLGEIKFYPDWLTQGLDIDLDFLHLANLQASELDNVIATKRTEQESTEQESTANVVVSESKGSKIQISDDKVIENVEDIVLENINVIDENIKPHHINHLENAKLFANMPRLTVYCKRCKYGLYDFGEVSFNVKRENENTLLLNQFIAKRGKTNIAFDGKWQQEGEHSITSVKGLLDTDNVAREVENVGYVSTIKDSGLDMSYQLNWQGGPHDFASITLGGDLDVSFDDGYLANVDDNGVRVFSLLSLQSLVRKLSFDFRDVFSDGMFYSKLTGRFNIKNGVAYTDDTYMKGSAGDLSIVGNTNLYTSELDYRMSYKPNLTSSLPVLAWIATLNPITFLAGVALDEVITSAVISEINFEVTGNLDKPAFKQVSKKTKNISVGRSSPPKILNDEDDQITTEQEAQNQPSAKDEINE